MPGKGEVIRYDGDSDFTVRDSAGRPLEQDEMGPAYVYLNKHKGCDVEDALAFARYCRGRPAGDLETAVTHYSMARTEAREAEIRAKLQGLPLNSPERVRLIDELNDLAGGSDHATAPKVRAQPFFVSEERTEEPTIGETLFERLGLELTPADPYLRVVRDVGDEMRSHHVDEIRAAEGYARRHGLGMEEAMAVLGFQGRRIGARG